MDTFGRSKLNGNKKSQTYKAIIEPIWRYRLQIWSTSTKIEYLKSGKSPILNAPWLVRNDEIRETLKIPTVEREITNRTNAHLSGIKNYVWLKKLLFKHPQKTQQKASEWFTHASPIIRINMQDTDSF